MPKVLLFGATGLVGSGIAAELTRNHPDWTLSSYHRNASKDEALRSAYNIEKVYHGTFEDSDKIRAAAKEHDFVINAGESSTLEPSKSIVDGLLERGGSGRGAKGTFVNISGTGNFIDNHKDGKHHPESRVWSVSTASTWL